MSGLDKLERHLSRPVVILVVLCFIVAIALLNALPRMGDAIWQDEAYTLLRFSTKGGMLFPFLNYSSPNSHVLFSSLQTGWMALFPAGVDIFTLRSLPLLLFLASVPVTFAAAFRLGGPWVAIVAATLFASASVTSNFATQLRGYGPSWIFLSLILLCALNIFGNRAKWWRAGYLLACLGAVAMLPTNLFLAFVVGCAASLGFLCDPKHRDRSAMPGFAVLLAGPFFGLLAYVAVWSDLAKYRNLDLSTWSRWELVDSWLRGTQLDLLWVAPIIVASAIVGVTHLVRSKASDGESTKALVVSGSLIFGLLAAVLLMSNAPFPRTLVPFLPVWFCAIATLLVQGVRHLLERRHLALMLSSIALIAVALLLKSPQSSCRGATGAKDDYDLCYQYFHDSYRPDQVLEVWQLLERPDAPIVADYEGAYALLALGAEQMGVKVSEYSSFRARGGPSPVIVAVDHPGLVRIATSLRADPATYGEVADTGHFKVYAQRRYAAKLAPMHRDIEHR